MRSKLLLLFTLFTFVDEALATDRHTFNLDAALWDNVPFVANDAPTSFGSYLVRNLPFEPIRVLKGALEETVGKRLSGRGEAHITVITPPEYDQIKSKVNISEINDIVRDSIQDAKFDVVCLGKGSAELSDKLENTYFIVVAAQELSIIRHQVAQLFYGRGGSRMAFDPTNFYPHITVAYTKRDLHAQDGVIKDQNSCFADVRIVEQL